MSDTATIIPSIDAAVATAVAGIPNPVIPPELAEKLKKPAETTPAEPKQEQKPEPESKQEPSKGLESIADLSDGVEPEKPAEQTEQVADDAPMEGEKPAKFIDRLKKELAAERNRAKQLEQEVAKKQAADPEAIESLRREIAEREAVIEETRFECSKTFQNEYAKPLEREEKAAQEFIAKFTEEKGVFEKALAMDVKERADFLEAELGAVKAATALNKLDTVERMRQARDAALQDRAARAATLAQEREASETKALINQFDSQREDMAKRLSVFRGDNADVLWNQAKSLISGEASPETVLSAAALAVAAPHYINELKRVTAENATLRARIKEDAGDRVTLDPRGSEAGKGTGLIRNGKLPSIDEAISEGLKRNP